MKPKNLFILTTICLLFGASFCPAQMGSIPGGTNIKAGFVHGIHGNNLPSLAIEHEFLRNLSAELKFAGSPLLGRNYRNQEYFDFHFMADVRYYFALRREMSLTGFFAGAFYGIERLNTYGPKYSPKLSFYKSSTLGFQIGYQHRFGRYFLVDGGLQTGAFIKNRFIQNDVNGNFVKEYKLGNGLPLANSLYLGFGLMLHQNRNGDRKETPPTF